MSLKGSVPRDPGGAPRVRAIVWRAPGSEVPGDLAAALARQSIGWEESVGPFEAFSRVLALPGRSQGRVLLLVEPDTLDRADEVRRAIERYEPEAACWAYRAAAHPRLAPLGRLPTPAEPEIVVKPRPKPSNGSHLRLSGSGPGAPGDGANGSETDHDANIAGEAPGREPESPRSVLTPEELEMLLADDRE